jgi:hypothetical protein
MNQFFDCPVKRSLHSMNYLHKPNHFGDQNFFDYDEASWPAIVDLIFEIVAHRDRIALKRRAFGRHKRRLTHKQRQRVTQ